MIAGDEHAAADVSSGAYEAMRTIGPNDIVLDIGAHVGFFSDVAAAKAKHVYCFEPHTRNFGVLLDRMHGKKNVTCLNVACADRFEWTHLWVNKGNSGGHSLSRNEGLHSGELVNVLMIDIGYLLIEATGLAPTFVKIDAEGAESQIIHSLLQYFNRLREFNTHFAYEVHSVELYHQCRTHFTRCGWKVSPVLEHVGVCYAWI